MGVLSRAGTALRQHPDLIAVTLVGVVALLLRLAFLYRVPVILTGDSQSHYLPGFDLVFGNQFEPELRRPPGYAIFAAGTIALLGEELRALVFVQQLLGVATALFTYALARVTFGRGAGVLAGLGAGLLVALNGALILSGQSIMTETLFTALLLATLLLLLLAGRSGHWGWALLAGLTLGGAALTRPVAQALVALVPLAFLLYSRHPWQPWRHPWPIVRGTLLVGVGVGLVLVPWMARNYAEHGTLSAAGGLGRSLIARTIKYDEGYFDDERPVVEGDLKSEARQFIRGKRNTIRNSRSVRSTQAGLMKEFGLSQAESDRLMRQIALEMIAERPGYYAAGSLQMAWQIVLGKEKEDTYSDRWVMRRDKDWIEQWEPRVHHLLPPATTAEQRSVETAQWISELFQPASVGSILPILAGLGVTLATVTARPALLPGLAGLGILLASAALDGPVPRYRYPLDPLIALFAAGAVALALQWIVGFWRRRSESDSRRREPPRQSRVSAAPIAEATR
jgi:4-amino-4-deoxy-L-arabinose transferase-like glycosyltransferase